MNSENVQNYGMGSNVYRYAYVYILFSPNS